MSHTIEDDDEFMNDTLEDMIRDIEVDAFEKVNMVDTLQRDMEESIYAGCKSFIILSDVLRLFNLKSRGGWTNISFTKFLKEMLP